MTRAVPSRLELVGLRKSLGGNAILHGIDLDVAGGSFVSLLGPSGCGKTTTLNIISGFLDPDHGEIRVDGLPITNLPPHRRDLAMVFQNYALFPHMTIFDNIAFGLRMRKTPKSVIEERVREALAMVHLPGMERRYPRQLSGGQQQRIGLARALAVRPRVLLLDEPLSNLDAALRKTMQMELRRIQQQVGITTIYVTHDQEEALTLSDRVAVMNMGRVEQFDVPETIYARPISEFVAGFIGESSAFDAVVCTHGRSIRLPGGAEVPALVPSAWPVGTSVRALVRPDRVSVETASLDATGPRGILAMRTFAGSHSRCVIDLPEGLSLLAHVPVSQAQGLRVGDTVSARILPGDWIVLPMAGA